MFQNLRIVDKPGKRIATGLDWDGARVVSFCHPIAYPSWLFTQRARPMPTSAVDEIASLAKSHTRLFQHALYSELKWPSLV